MRLLVDLLDDVVLEAKGRLGGAEALLRDTVLVAQELGEVPLQALAEDAVGEGVAQVLVDGVSLLAILALELAQERKGHIESLLRKLLDLSVSAGLLLAKVVAGESKNL